MESVLQGKDYKLSKIFSSEFDFEIPDYQRPYAWSVEETGTLFDDLFDFYSNESKDNKYFLGSIVLIKKQDDKPLSDVVDGQQRLTTLTILLACITSKTTGEFYTDFLSYIIENGRPSQGIPSRPRLRIRKRDNDFFEKYIQKMNFEELFKLDEDNQETEAQNNIIKNAKCLMKRIEDNFSDENQIRQFGSFLVERCLFVVVTTSDFNSAFRIFSIMNSRGMSLLMTDIFKSNMIGQINESMRSEYNRKWEEMEVELGRNEFNDLFGQIRMILLKTKPKKNIQEEYEKYIFLEKSEKASIDFIDNELIPYADAYSVLTGSQYVSSQGAEKVNEVLRWLNKIDNTDWLPAAMAYYVKFNNEPDELYRFLKKLERLAAYLRITSSDINHRIERYGEVLWEIEKNGRIDDKSSIELSDEEKDVFLEKLSGDIYNMTSKKRNYFILRLDSFIAAAGARYDAKVFTIEHVLPQTVDDKSEWAKIWPDEEIRKYWVHKIGNLIPLNKRQNSAAQNYDFDVKKEKYFRSKEGVNSYALASSVLQYPKWTPEVVERRQNELIEAYKKGWDL